MKKILVIEDHAQTRNLFLDCLKAEGFYPIGAENGLIGLQIVLENLPDLIICDIMVPELDGYGVLTKLRQNTATAITPFIFVTAKATVADFRKGMDMGADDYLIKPCTVEDLLKAIAVRLEKQAALQQWCVAEFQQILEPPSADTVKPTASQSIFPTCPQLTEVFHFIETNYHQSIGLRDVAQAVGYSPAYLTDLVRRQTGQTVNRWIVERRITEACFLLRDTNQSVEAIAETVGYLSAGHFFRQFRQYRGITPQTWRNTQRTQVRIK